MDHRINSQQLLFFITLLSIAVGVYVRLDQFLIQTLIDDEWHAVNQLLHSTPTKFASSFGHADYSIPLTLLYWLEARLFGLSELMMRWPMMLFGLATLIIFPVYVYRYFSHLEAAVFSFLLALSPLLDIYCRTARPYAITLFLVYISIWAFYKFWEAVEAKKIRTGVYYTVVYCLSASFAVWLHLVVAFFVVSPFIIQTVRLLFKPKSLIKRDLFALLKIGLPTLLLTSALILPPLLSSLNALTVKGGTHLPSLDTFIGAVYLWLGTESGIIVSICSILAVVGFSRLYRKSVVTINILVGFVLTSMLIFMSQPAWVKHPLTLARYLLPIVPLLLLSIASGMYVAQERLVKLFRYHYLQFGYCFIALGLLSGYTAMSPLLQLLHHPNSNTLHSFYFFDFRRNKNIIDDYLRAHSYSEFWRMLKNSPTMSKKIAVAPWYFESHFWHAPIWEEISHQIVLPGYLDGLCVNDRAGEVPDNERFHFRNVSYLADPNDLHHRGIDFIVYQKLDRNKLEVSYANIIDCGAALERLYGPPIHEDAIVKVYNPYPKEQS